MADLNIRVTPGVFRWGLAALLLSISAAELSTESVTLSTYYPAPSGVYTQMITTSNTYLARDAGRVGIGTTNPAFKLHVFPEAGGQVAINGQTNAATNLAYVVFNHNDGTNTGWVGDGSGGDSDMGLAATNDLRFYSGGNFATPRMYIASGGNVGIRTTAPAASLEVGPAGANTGLIVLRQTGCVAVAYTSGDEQCPGQTYATLAAGLYTRRWELGNIAPASGGTMLCCPPPSPGMARVF